MNNEFSWHFRRGRAAYKRGEPTPKCPLHHASHPESTFWYGYMFERALKLMEQWRVRGILEDDPDPDDRPRKAA